MATRLRTQDRCRRVIELNDERLLHIIRRHGLTHPERDIQQAIERPTRVMDDVNWSDRENYYRAHASGRRYLKVTVAFEGDSGTIITAYFTEATKEGEEQLWP